MLKIILKTVARLRYLEFYRRKKNFSAFDFEFSIYQEW